MGEVATQSDQADLESGPFSLSEAARILNLSPRRLRYWHRTNVGVGVRVANGSVRFDFRELAGTRNLIRLRERGVSLQWIRNSVRWAQAGMVGVNSALTSLRFYDGRRLPVWSGSDGMLFESGGQRVIEWEVTGKQEVEAIFRDDLLKDLSDDEVAWLAFEEGCRLDSDRANLDQAILAYRLAIQANPDFADAHSHLGALYHRCGERKKALTCYVAALTADRQHLASHFNVARLHEEEGRDSIALHHYRCAVQIDPVYADAHLNLALLYEKVGLLRLARRRWSRYLELCPAGHWANVARRRLGA